MDVCDGNFPGGGGGSCCAFARVALRRVSLSLFCSVSDVDSCGIAQWNGQDIECTLDCAPSSSFSSASPSGAAEGGCKSIICLLVAPRWHGINRMRLQPVSDWTQLSNRFLCFRNVTVSNCPMMFMSLFSRGTNLPSTSSPP